MWLWVFLQLVGCVWVLWWVLSILDKLLQLPLLDEGFNLLLKVVAFVVIVLVVLVETTVLVPVPFA